MNLFVPDVYFLIHMFTLIAILLYLLDNRLSHKANYLLNFFINYAFRLSLDILLRALKNITCFLTISISVKITEYGLND
ncbi:hypothetical protein ABID23_000589 [Bartonella silvatica]|uniref:Uncharacterized protein n=1 Tax=Bartonella silvatica TaxID=357760 RepID=A0ABV2HH44_9HYPH